MKGLSNMLNGQFEGEDLKILPRWCGYCGNAINVDMPKFLQHLKDCEAAQSQYIQRMKDKK